MEFTEISDIEKRRESFRFKVRHGQSTGAMTSIRVDLSLRGDVMMEHPAKPVLHFYEALKNPFCLHAMALEEIMAEKIRAVTYTKHPRHLYDIQYLRHRGVKINPEMAKAKIKSAYGEDFDLDKLRERLPEKAKGRISGLGPPLPTPPSFDVVSKEVLEAIADAMS